MLWVTIRRTLLILGSIGRIIFFTGVDKIIHIHCSPWGQIIKSTLVFKLFVRFSSNFICILQSTVSHIVLILWSSEFIDRSQENKKTILIHYSFCVNVHASVCEWTRQLLNGVFDLAQIWYVYYKFPSDEPYWFWWM